MEGKKQGESWKEYYDKENMILSIYNRALKHQKMFGDGHTYIKMSKLDDILREYIDK